ncbi:MAG: RidA family protein [Pseudomonadota bacterium]
MRKTPVNPWAWSLNFGYNQAELLEGAKRQLVCAGQTAVDGEGNPQHPQDMRKQLELVIDNLEAVLKGADMAFSNLSRLCVYSTDVDETLKHFDILGSRLGAKGATPPMTLLGVSRLARPELLIEIDATAVD